MRFWQGDAQAAFELSTAILERFPTAFSFRLTTAWSQALLGRLDEARAAMDDLWGDDFAGLPRDSLWLLHMDLSAGSPVCSAMERSPSVSTDAPAPPSSVVASQTIWFEPVALVLGLVATHLGRYDEAEDHFRRALEILERIGRPPPWCTPGWSGPACWPGGPDRRRPARALLEAARPHARELEMTGIEAKIQALSACLGNLRSALLGRPADAVQAGDESSREALERVPSGRFASHSLSV